MMITENQWKTILEIEANLHIAFVGNTSIQAKDFICNYIKDLHPNS